MSIKIGYSIWAYAYFNALAGKPEAKCFTKSAKELTSMKKIKYLLAFACLSCFAFMLGTGVLSAAGSNAANSVNSPTTPSTQSYDNRSMNNYHATSTTGGNYRANAVNDDNDFDWGWLGLLGLIGLAGMRSRNQNRNPERS
jgi:hypothetical protein